MRIRKRDRNKLNHPDPLGACERQRKPSNFSEGGEALVLADPKTKLTAKLRRRYSTSRAHIVCAPRSAAVAEPIKYARKLSRLSLMQVLREIKKNARKAATAKGILKGLLVDTIFGQQIFAEQNRQLHRMRQAVAERASRTTTSPDQLVK